MGDPHSSDPHESAYDTLDNEEHTQIAKDRQLIKGLIIGFLFGAFGTFLWLPFFYNYQ